MQFNTKLACGPNLLGKIEPAEIRLAPDQPDPLFTEHGNDAELSSVEEAKRITDPASQVCTLEKLKQVYVYRVCGF